MERVRGTGVEGAVEGFDPREPFERIVWLGEVEEWTGSGRAILVRVWVKVQWTGGEKGRLSLVGVVGPKRNGDAWGGCGQIQHDLAPERFRSYAPGWGEERVRWLKGVWERWHSNDMRAGCEHQRDEGWDKRPIDPSKPLEAYGKWGEKQRTPSWNRTMLVWVRPDEVQGGLLGVPCGVCGYRYGSRWLWEEVERGVLEGLWGMEEPKERPAWI